MSNEDELLRIEGIRKTFPGVVALDGVDFDLRGVIDRKKTEADAAVVLERVGVKRGRVQRLTSLSSPTSPTMGSPLMNDYDLLVVGSANADLVIGVERRPAAGETVLGSDLAVHPGGKGANQAVAAARLGARTALLARVGDDAHGRLLLDSQRAAGVDTAGVLVGGAPTGVALITVDPSGDNSIVVSPGANGRLTPEDVRAAEEPASGPPGWSRRSWRSRWRRWWRSYGGCSRGRRFVLNPSPPRPLPAEVLAACDPLIVNEHEAQVIAGRGLRGDVAGGLGAGAARARAAVGGRHAGRGGGAGRRPPEGSDAGARP